MDPHPPVRRTATLGALRDRGTGAVPATECVHRCLRTRGITVGSPDPDAVDAHCPGHVDVCFSGGPGGEGDSGEP